MKLLVLCSLLLYLFALPVRHSFAMMRNAVVTGANRGLGLEICRQLLLESKNWDNIYALCRKTSPELDALATTTSDDTKVSVIEGIDMVKGDFETVVSQRLTQEDGTATPISLLIHNAGGYGPPEDFTDPDDVYRLQSLENITPERLVYAFHLNSAAPLFLTQQLLPNLRANNNKASNDTTTKVIIISSLMGSIHDNTSGGHYGYRGKYTRFVLLDHFLDFHTYDVSFSHHLQNHFCFTKHAAAKAAVNMIGKSMSADLAPENIAVGLIHPGFVHTGFGAGPGQAKRHGQRNVQESVQGVLQAVQGVTMETTGRFWHGNYGEGVKELKW